jgi:hypothetical protein
MPSLHDVCVGVAESVLDVDTFDKALAEHGIASEEAVAQSDKMAIIPIESILESINCASYDRPEAFLIDFVLRSKEAFGTTWLSGFLMGLQYAKVSREADE